MISLFAACQEALDLICKYAETDSVYPSSSTPHFPSSSSVMLSEVVAVLEILQASLDAPLFWGCVLRLAVALTQVDRRHPGLIHGRSLAHAS